MRTGERFDPDHTIRVEDAATGFRHVRSREVRLTAQFVMSVAFPVSLMILFRVEKSLERYIPAGDFVRRDSYPQACYALEKQ